MPSPTPLVSIVMPFRNTASYLAECVNSIQEQSYTFWELHAVNDHSEDNSLELMQEYARNDFRIHVHPNMGKGIIPALREAYKRCSGELVTRMDSDDIMLPERIGHMAASIQKAGRGHVAVGGVQYFSDKGISDGYKKYESWLNALTSKGINFTELYKECVIPSPCWMLHRDDFEKAGGFAPDRYPEDYDLTFRFYETGLQIIPCDKTLHRWRDYPSRTSRNHEHYAQNYFLDIKMHYFLKLHFDQERTLTLWGAGNKGKVIAKTLIENNVAFKWMCDNPRKIGRKIYGVLLQHYSEIEQITQPQCIISVANEEAQKEIRGFLSSRDLRPMQDYFFFC